MQITLDNQLETNFSISICINNLKIIPMHFPGFWYSSQSVSTSLRCNRPSYVEHHFPLQCRWIFKNVYSAIIMVSKVIQLGLKFIIFPVSFPIGKTRAHSDPRFYRKVHWDPEYNYHHPSLSLNESIRTVSKADLDSMTFPRLTTFTCNFCTWHCLHHVKNCVQLYT